MTVSGDEQADSGATQNPASLKPLRGISVLEFSHTIMGPCAGMVLADLGADVIKIEPAPGGDKTRDLRGFAAGFFATFNRNKQSVAINLKTEAGQSIVHRLIETTDIVLDNYGPGTMEKLGCGYDSLRCRNAGLIYLSLKGYLSGPWQDRPALDEVVQFQSGLAYMTGPPGQPLRAGASIVDILGAVFGVTGVLAALREREKTGYGQRVGSALFESAAFLMASHMVGGQVTGKAVPPMTARKGAWAIYDVFVSSDHQQLFIGVTSDAQWQRFCKEFALDELLADQRLATNPERTLMRSWLLPEVGKALANYSFDELKEGCFKADVSFSPVAHPEDLATHEQLLDQGLLDTALDTVRHAVSDEIRNSVTQIPGLPLEFGDDRLRTRLQQDPPDLGQHTGPELTRAGYLASEIKQFHDDGVIL